MGESGDFEAPFNLKQMWIAGEVEELDRVAASRPELQQAVERLKDRLNEDPVGYFDSLARDNQALLSVQDRKIEDN